MILVGATIAPWKCDGKEELLWLENAEAMVRDSICDLHYMVVLEVDARGLEPYRALLKRMECLSQYTVWTFSFDDDADKWDSGNRLVRICTGRNFVTEFANRQMHCSHILYQDTDITIPADSVNKLLELGWPIVGGDVPSYCLGGEPVRFRPGFAVSELDAYCAHLRHGDFNNVRYSFPVETHMNTAGFLMVSRRLFRVLRWRYDLEGGLTDDPCYEADAHRLGFKTLVRKDVIGLHPPLARVEDRTADMVIRRSV